MPFSSIHRFQKAHDIHYSLKMNVAMISEISGISIDILQPIYDEEYAKTGRNHAAILAVCSYCNGGKVYKERHIQEK